MEGESDVYCWAIYLNTYFSWGGGGSDEDGTAPGGTRLGLACLVDDEGSGISDHHCRVDLVLSKRLKDQRWLVQPKSMWEDGMRHLTVVAKMYPANDVQIFITNLRDSLLSRSQP